MDETRWRKRDIAAWLMATALIVAVLARAVWFGDLLYGFIAGLALVSLGYLAGKD